MKSMKKLVLVGLVLLASVMVLVGCDTNAGDTPKSANNALPLTIKDANGNSMSVTLEDTDSDGFYEIGTADELYAFAAAVNDKGLLTINGKLTSSIVVNETVLDEQGKISENVTFRSWTPIGTNDYKYTGTFDGAGYTISGLYFDNTNAGYAGLFGYLGKGGSVQNLGVLDSYFCGGKYVGGVVGQNRGTVSNCYNTGAVSGTATGEDSYCDVGGVVGQNYEGAVTNCYNTGAVSGTGTNCDVGGVVGDNYDAVSNCYNTGAVSGTGTNCKVGGVVGENSGDVSNCYYLSGTAERGVDAGEGDAEVKDKTFFASEEMATLFNANQEDGPWEYISGKPAPTLKAFNEG
ncbi:MAG: hypothetical protein J6R96_04080 [Spirochaetaceae bacterium]|nr:hypothetical protein [Spirochaetaceae bacterium]